MGSRASREEKSAAIRRCSSHGSVTILLSWDWSAARTPDTTGEPIGGERVNKEVNEYRTLNDVYGCRIREQKREDSETKQSKVVPSLSAVVSNKLPSNNNSFVLLLTRPLECGFVYKSIESKF